MMTTQTAPSLMTITARYASTCPACSHPIAVGAQVLWARGEKARHVACPTAGAGAEAAQVTTVTRTITVTREGRRSYIGGDTMAVRGLLRAGGCHWDADRKQWWIGSHEAALQLAEQARGATAEAAPRKQITHCIGCGCALDRFQIQRGYKTCSRDCSIEQRMGSGWSGHVPGHGWHQGSDD